MMQKKKKNSEQSWWDKHSNEERKGIKKVDEWNKSPRIIVHKMWNMLMNGYIQNLIVCFEEGLCRWVWESGFILKS